MICKNLSVNNDGHLTLGGVDVTEMAKKYGTIVSFDFNYRASFWKNREKELQKIFGEIAGLSDIIIGNESDYMLCLGMKFEAVGRQEELSPVEHFKETVKQVKKHFPEVTVLATNIREVKSADRHLWGCVMQNGNEFEFVEPKEISIIDRIGGGDGFVGGLLYSIIKGFPHEEQLHFAWASGVLASTFLTDYAQPESEEQIWDIWNKKVRIKR